MANYNCGDISSSPGEEPRKRMTDYREYESEAYETIAGWLGNPWIKNQADQVCPAFEIKMPLELEFEIDLIDCQEYPIDYISEASIINPIEME